MYLHSLASFAFKTIPLCKTLKNEYFSFISKEDIKIHLNILA